MRLRSIIAGSNGNGSSFGFGNPIMSADLDSLRQLPLAEKLRVVEALWDDIAVSTEDFPLPAWLRSEIEQRLAEHEKDPAAVLTRAQLWQRVDEKRG
jgi:putative addiction module component (TIGR02574 family)